MMDRISELTTILGKKFSWNKARLDCFSQMLLALLDIFQHLTPNTILAIAFYSAHKIGEWRAIKKPIPFKRFRRSIRPQHSLFRYGLNFIRELLLNFKTSAADFMRCLAFLTGSPDNIHTI